MRQCGSTTVLRYGSLVVLLYSVLTATLAAQELPAGPGAEVLKARCLACHGADLIVSQRLSLAGWMREVDKMVRWGATMETVDRDILQPYLAANFGPRPAPSHASATAASNGEATYKRACLSCHGADLAAEQRLSRAGWVREVEKMIRWGATVADTDKDALVDHLAGQFGAR